MSINGAKKCKCLFVNDMLKFCLCSFMGHELKVDTSLVVIYMKYILYFELLPYQKRCPMQHAASVGGVNWKTLRMQHR